MPLLQSMLVKFADGVSLKDLKKQSSSKRLFSPQSRSSISTAAQLGAYAAAKSQTIKVQRFLEFLEAVVRVMPVCTVMVAGV